MKHEAILLYHSALHCTQSWLPGLQPSVGQAIVFRGLPGCGAAAAFPPAFGLP